MRNVKWPFAVHTVLSIQSQNLSYHTPRYMFQYFDSLILLVHVLGVSDLQRYIFQQINEFVRILKCVDLQPHYEVITELLAKSGKIEDDDGLLLKPKTDSRQIFYIFCALMQICHSHYFSWWMAISSTAAYHGKTNSNITSFFRIMMLWITRFDYSWQSGDGNGKRNNDAGVNVIDNTQVQTLLRKYQRNRISSNMNMAVYWTSIFRSLPQMLLKGHFVTTV